MTSNNSPSRKIPKNYNNITGRVFSKKSNRLIGFESKLERDFIYLFEFDNNIKTILEQPLTIKYKYGDNFREYTPDFYIQFNNKQKNFLVEIKYKDDLKKRFKEYKFKFKAASFYAQNNNLEFKILTNECPQIKNKNYLFNVHFLLKYDYITYDNYKLIQSLINDCHTIENILNKLSNDKYIQASFIGNIWALIRHHILFVNLYEKLTVKAKILEFRTLDKSTYEEIFGSIPTKGLFR